MKLITIEGMEGVGKSTCIKFIQTHLQKNDLPYLVTREPGGTPFAERIRQLFLHVNEQEEIAPETELLLAFAARAQHLKHVIKPALSRGQWVICDRFTDSSFAYQGAGRGVPFEKIEALEEWIQGDFKPAATILLLAPLDVSLSRIAARKKWDRFEVEDRAFFQRIYTCYQEMAAQDPLRYHVVDANQDLASVQRALVKILDKLMRNQ